MKRSSDTRRKIDLFLLMLVLPLVGVMLSGERPVKYLEFPPLTRYVAHAGFSWTVFIGLAVLILAAMLPFILCVLVSGRRPSAVSNSESRVSAFPSWGWAGLAFGVLSTLLAWTRFEWFAPLQLFTFTPHWLAYIVVVNALTQWRTGRCMMLNRTAYFSGLFVVSAVFWWFFEYLNRFVQNWYYTGIGDLSRGQYFLFATLPFATVLPAVLGTYEWLETIPRLSAGLDDFVRLRVPRPRLMGWLGMLVACAGLAGIGVWPDRLFPLLWVSPLFIITSYQALCGRPTVFTPIREGRWRRVVLLALASLVCGFFWEMWNAWSLAQWIYNVPFVNRFKLFEMPILGYSGYLPFGLECWVVAEAVFVRPPEDDTANAVSPRLRRAGRSAMAVLLAGAGLYFFIVPGFLLMRNLSDPALKSEAIPRVAWRMHRRLAPRYAAWARDRIASGKAGDLPLYDVPSTEWPMFGSVYYLWATESLQAAWDRESHHATPAPRVYAREAIEACVDLVLDPVHHTWVRTHWGDDYMHNQNLFFRALIIAALTSHETLVGDGRHLALLRDQVETLSAELDASPHGVLNDYPDECYPIDVLAAIACIRRADRVLGTDHTAFVQRAVRAFSGDMLDPRGLIPYLVDAETAVQLGPSRGVGNSYILIFAHELWPERADEWYERYEQHFWQSRWWAAGFREFPRDMAGHDWTYDVDAGPIIAGFSPAANAFGVAGAKVSGRLDHAYTLACQVLAACWPLPDGSSLGTRILSNPVHAPYLGEACVLFFLTQQPAPGVKIRTGEQSLPTLVYIGYCFFFGVGICLCIPIIRETRHLLAARTYL